MDANIPREREEIPDAEYASAIQYEMQAEAGLPAWFAPAINQALQPLKEDIQTLRRKVASLTATVAKIENYKRGAGVHSRLEVVPFPDGTFPSEQDPPLPSLNTVGAVNGLSAANRDSYLAKYYPEEIIAGTAREKRGRLFRALGCSWGAN